MNGDKKYNLVVIVIFITVMEGLAIYFNMLEHPDFQPVLTAIIIVLTAIVSGLVVWYFVRR